MAKIYLEKLNTLIDDLKLKSEVSQAIESKHFFSGAALYVNKTICVSWSPAGLAFKLVDSEVEQLISTGRAIPLKYFPKGNVKKGYALFESPDLNDQPQWKSYFIKAINKASQNNNI